MPLSDERLAEIRKRCDTATPGPWEVDEESGDVWVPSIWRSVAIIEDLDLPLVNPAADRAFIAAARADVSDLLDEVERLRARNAELEEQNARWQVMVDNVVGQTAGTLMRAQDAERRIAERQGGHEWRRH